MKINIIHILILSLLALGSCKKLESPLEGTQNTLPIYKMIGLINGNETDFTVNNNTIQMNYGMEEHRNISSYYTVFEDIKKSASIKFSITSPKKHYNLQQLPTDSKVINFLVHEVGTYKFGFDNPPPVPPIVSFLENNQYISTASITFEEYGIYNLDLKFKGQSSRTFKQTINHGFVEESTADFELYNIQSGIYYSCYNDNGNSHEWFLDGDKESDMPHGVLFISTGIHTLTHIETDSWGNTKEFSHIFYVSQGNLKWMFKADLENTISEHNNFDHITITYVENGITYSSSAANENHVNNFHIKNIEYFKENENNDVISLKFDATFNAILYNEDGKKVELKDFTGTCKYALQ